MVGYAWREVRTNLRRDFASANSSISCDPYREGVKHRLCGPYWGMYAITYLVTLWIIMFKGNIEGFFIYHKRVKIKRFQLM